MRGEDFMSTPYAITTDEGEHGRTVTVSADPQHVIEIIGCAEHEIKLLVTELGDVPAIGSRVMVENGTRLIEVARRYRTEQGAWKLQDALMGGWYTWRA